MKNFKKFIAGILLFTLLILALSSCTGQQVPTVPIMRSAVGSDILLDSGIYNYYMSVYKTIILYNYGQQMDYPELWDMEFDTGSGIVQSVNKSETINVQETIKNRFAAVILFDELGLKLSQEDKNSIDEAVSELISSSFGNSKNVYQATLARFGLDDANYRETRFMDIKYEKLLQELFAPETGKYFESVQTKFETDYVRIKHVLLSNTSSETDESGNPIDYTEEELAAVRADAEGILKRAQTEDFDGLLGLSEDPGTSAYPEGYTFTYGNMVPEFEEAAFDMEIGEVRLVETDFGYHIMKKYQLDSAEISSASNQSYQEIVSELMADQLKPYVDRIVIDEEEAGKIDLKSVDTMFDCLVLIQ